MTYLDGLAASLFVQCMSMEKSSCLCQAGQPCLDTRAAFPGTGFQVTSLMMSMSRLDRYKTQTATHLTPIATGYIPISRRYIRLILTMTATQPPYQATNFDNPTPNFNSYSLSSTPGTTTTPADTTVGKEASTADPHTGPAPTTAGPHHHDIANRLDPRVDSDLNDRAQYAPGTTVSGNVHPGTTVCVSNPESSNGGPHSSALYNKLDPRVDSKTGNMTTKTTNQTGTGSARAPTDTTGAGLAHGSSTSSVGAPGVQDTRSQYDPHGTGYNPSTGSGYDPSAGYSGQDYRAGYAPSTVSKESGGYGDSLEPQESSTGSTKSSLSQKSDKIGKGLQSTLAGIHVSDDSILLSLKLVGSTDT